MVERSHRRGEEGKRLMMCFIAITSQTNTSVWSGLSYSPPYTLSRMFSSWPCPPLSSSSLYTTASGAPAILYRNTPLPTAFSPTKCLSPGTDDLHWWVQNTTDPSFKTWLIFTIKKAFKWHIYQCDVLQVDLALYKLYDIFQDHSDRGSHKWKNESYKVFISWRVKFTHPIIWTRKAHWLRCSGWKVNCYVSGG